MKKFITLLFILILCVISGAVYFIANKNFDAEPIPYIMTNYRPANVEKAQESQILILGDQMGREISKYKQELMTAVNSAVTKEVNFYNWSEVNEGLHRTLKKLKSLKKLPPVIIYQASNSEFYEGLFYPKEMNNILYNINKFKDVNIATLLTTFPWASLYYYKNIKKPTISQFPKKLNISLPARFIPKYLKVSYELYKLNLEEFIKYAKINNTNLILVTAPINLEIAPKRVCEHTSTNTLFYLLNEMEKELEKDNPLLVLQKLNKLKKDVISNPRFHYIRGKALASAGQIMNAKDELQKVSAFDCELWRATSVHNAIMKNLAAKYNILLVDFDEFVNRSYGKNTTFLNDLFPQFVHYEKFAELLGAKLKRIMRLR